MSDTSVKVELITVDKRIDITDEVREMWNFITTSMEWGSGFLGYDEELRWIELGNRLGYDVTSQLENFRNILRRFEETKLPAENKTVYNAHFGYVSADQIATIREALHRFADDVRGFDE